MTACVSVSPGEFKDTEDTDCSAHNPGTLTCKEKKNVLFVCCYTMG